MSLRHVHVFESRADAFRDDGVLQENVVVLAERSRSIDPVLVTGSFGRDRETGRSEVRLRYSEALDDSTGDAIVRVVTASEDRDLLRRIDALPCRLRGLGLEVSTGPVVAFRAARFFLDERDADDSAPLLWMRNVRPFATAFPPAAPRQAGPSPRLRRLAADPAAVEAVRPLEAVSPRRRRPVGSSRASSSRRTPIPCSSGWRTI